ncbi:Hypothetical predicted protein, partial [Mytilus galloprovincialis]
IVCILIILSLVFVQWFGAQFVPQLVKLTVIHVFSIATMRLKLVRGNVRVIHNNNDMNCTE